MVVIRIPGPLQQFTSGAQSVAVEATTVGDALRELASVHRGLAERLFTPEGDLRRFVNIYVNQHDIRQLEGWQTHLVETDEVMIIPAIAGGGGDKLEGKALLCRACPCGWN